VSFSKNREEGEYPLSVAVIAKSICPPSSGELYGNRISELARDRRDSHNQLTFVV
jgi:hypothetical protein